MSTTYAAYHLEAVKSFDPQSSWIMSATEKPKRLPPPSIDQPTKPSTDQELAQSSNQATHQPISQPTSHAVNQSHPLYRTTNSHYGAVTPTDFEASNQSFNRPKPFSSEFAGGMFVQSGLDTGITKSRIVGEKTELGC